MVEIVYEQVLEERGVGRVRDRGVDFLEPEATGMITSGRKRVGHGGTLMERNRYGLKFIAGQSAWCWYGIWPW